MPNDSNKINVTDNSNDFHSKTILSKTETLNKTKTDNFIQGLWDYYQGVYNEDYPCIPILRSPIFSEVLSRFKENINQEELYPDCDSIWTHFENNFVIPEIFINGKHAYA